MINRKQLADLYHSGKSMAEIAALLKTPERTVANWMNKYGISRRTRSEATYVKRNPTGDPFKIKSTLSDNDQVLLGLGLGLWWGEGSKNI